jgi:Tfp pilus assembly protein FimT
MARPSKLTAETQETIVAMLRAGNQIEYAAEAAGVSRATAYAWLERGTKTGKINKPYADFAAAAEQARAEAHARHVALIAKASSKSWQAAAWLLERQYPEMWGKPTDRAKAAAAPETEPTADPFAEVDELAKRRTARPA